MTPIGAQTFCDLGENPQFFARIARRFERFADTLHATLAVGNGAIRFAPARRRGQDDVCEFRRLRSKDIEDDEVVEAPQRVLRVVLISVALHRIFTDHEDAFERAAIHRVEHLRERHAVLVLLRHAPGV